MSPHLETHLGRDLHITHSSHPTKFSVQLFSSHRLLHCGFTERRRTIQMARWSSHCFKASISIHPALFSGPDCWGWYRLQPSVIALDGECPGPCGAFKISFQTGQPRVRAGSYTSAGWRLGLLTNTGTVLCWVWKCPRCASKVLALQTTVHSGQWDSFKPWSIGESRFAPLSNWTANRDTEAFWWWLFSCEFSETRQSNVKKLREVQSCVN